MPSKVGRKEKKCPKIGDTTAPVAAIGGATFRLSHPLFRKSRELQLVMLRLHYLPRGSSARFSMLKDQLERCTGHERPVVFVNLSASSNGPLPYLMC
ncbi:hypothetical protein SAY87_011343 [Trapa incisa]|uniref:Uncharacterized protein n=1 Tax=Trapa incisa TaxID=236973 RepID=A0AAN7GFY4_9MYRT|nr:hypothetical protein SAY87_011343 [Trapa incisa]